MTEGWMHVFMNVCICVIVRVPRVSATCLSSKHSITRKRVLPVRKTARGNERETKEKKKLLV